MEAMSTSGAMQLKLRLKCVTSDDDPSPDSPTTGPTPPLPPPRPRSLLPTAPMPLELDFPELEMRSSMFRISSPFVDEPRHCFRNCEVASRRSFRRLHARWISARSGVRNALSSSPSSPATGYMPKNLGSVVFRLPIPVQCVSLSPFCTSGGALPFLSVIPRCAATAPSTWFPRYSLRSTLASSGPVAPASTSIAVGSCTRACAFLVSGVCSFDSFGTT